MGGQTRHPIGQHTQQEMPMHSLMTLPNGETAMVMALATIPQETTLMSAQESMVPLLLTE